MRVGFDAEVKPSLGTGVALTSGIIFGTLLFLMSPGMMLLAMSAAAVFVTLLRTPRWGLILFGFIAMLAPYSAVQLGIRMTVSEALLAMTWASLWARFAGTPIHLPRGTAERWLIRMMVFTAVPFVAGQIAIQSNDNGAVNWIRWLLSLSAMLLPPLLFPDEKSRERMVAALLLGTLLMSALSVGYFVAYRDAKAFIPVLKLLHYAHPEAPTEIFGANFQRMASPWVHPNMTGGMLVLMLPLAFFYALLRTGWQRALGASTALLGTMGLLFSGSRGAILSLALTLLALAWRRTPYAGKILAAAFVIGVGLVMWYPPLQSRLSTTFSASSASTQIRLDEYRHFPDAVKEFPLGIGFKADPPPPHTDLKFGISNLWLNFVYKIGIGGMLIFAMVILHWYRQTRPAAHLNRIDRQHAIWLGTSYGVLSALLTGFFDHYFSFEQVAIAVFWLMIGLSLQAARERGIASDPLLKAVANTNRIGSGIP